MLSDNKKTVKGRLDIFLVKDGIWEPVYSQSNLVANGASDICALTATGKRTIDTMYLCFENDPSAVDYVADAANTAAYYATASANRSFVRVATLGEPVIESTGPEYTGNKVTFMGVTDGTSFFPSVPVTDSTSVFYHAALVSAPADDSQAADMIFSCTDLATPITKIAGSNIGIRWAITF